MRFAVIADDMTGAGDAGVHFAAAGQRTALVLAEDGVGQAVADHDAVALSTESRFLSPEEAAARVAAAVRACRAAGTERVFKKIDSTLRGNVAAETAAALAAGGYAAALVCPAMPKTGRTVEGGVLLVHGVPVADCELGRDPFNPVPSSRVRDCLAGLVCGDLPLAVVRRGPAAIAEHMTGLIESGCAGIAADATTDADLAFLGAALWGDPRVLPAGAGGLAEAFVGGPAGDAVPLPGGRLLAVIGSLTAAGAEQAAHALARGRFAPLDLDMEQALAQPDAALAGLADQARAAGDRHLLLRNARPPAAGLDREAGLRAAATFGRAARAVAAAAGCERLYVTGGSTAVATAAALGMGAVTLVRECMPGVVLASCRPDDSPVRWFITKAGGFGAPDTLTRLGDIV